MSTFRRFFFAAALLLAWLSAAAEPSSLDQTLTELLPELRNSYENLSRLSGSTQQMVAAQHRKLAGLIQECNQLSLKLYSQEQENTFDLSYALSKVTEQYQRFQSERMPFDEIIQNMEVEQERYQRLVLTLEQVEDSLSLPMRDSCLAYAGEILAIYGKQLQQIDIDKAYYSRTDERLKEAYDYAQERYKTLQHKVFVKGQSSYFRTLKHFSRYVSRAWGDIKQCAWRTPVALLYTLGFLLLLLLAIVSSLLIRLDRKAARKAISAYLPTLILAVVIIFLRTVFAPNSVINLLVPVLMLGFCIWQCWMNAHTHKHLHWTDRALLWVSALVMTVSTVLSWKGLVMASLLLMVWWIFQLTLVTALMALSRLLDRYYGQYLQVRQRAYRRDNPELQLGSDKGACIEITWLNDLLKMTIFPLLGIWSVPVAAFLACRVFDFTMVATNLFFGPIVNVEGYLHLTLFKLMLVLSLFFVFRYLAYALKAFYRVWRTRAAVQKLGGKVAFKETDINFNLVNNISSLLVWLVYVVVTFVLLKIPTSALTIITTGLATGIGFAMKDILNNFFYGIQLMGGRVRVGDKIECDGIRGTVAGLSYQSTQIEANDGSIIVFTNTALFNKNFKNLTRNHSYEMLTFMVGVKYGTDVEKAREVIEEALQPLMVRDKYGREIVDKKKGISVRLADFGDSSVNLQVLLHTTVDTHYSFAAQAREAIYKAFAQNGIEIPFPQQDVYIKQMPEA